MKRYKITHQTDYDFSEMAYLLPHTLRLRPREGHELRIESSALDISPPASLRWHRDAEGNSVAIATFNSSARRITIKSEITLQQYNQSPHDFLVADYAVNYPFSYKEEDRVLLSPYMEQSGEVKGSRLEGWVKGLLLPNENIQTFALLLRLNQRIYQLLNYRTREEEGVQAAEQTLASGSGSCRDAAALFMAAARQLGFATRFVSGYIYSEGTAIAHGQSGATHAWTEVFIPGAGWKGFDPTIGNIVGADHIAVAVARVPESVPPIAGAFQGDAEAEMSVKVWVELLS